MSSSFRRQALVRILTGMIILAVAAALASGCKTSEGEGYYAGPWYNIYGENCGTSMPSPGCNYYSNGAKLYVWEDPFYGNSPQALCGIGYNPSTCAYSDGSYFWISPDGVMYDPYGNALNGDENQGSRDIIGASASESESTILAVGKKFAQKNALAEATGVRIARTLNQMATLPKRLNRARTQADVADFTQRLYGVDFSRVSEAASQYAAGNTADLKALNAEVARNWGTTPETTEAVLKAWYSSAAF